jgi:hypothetical protein
MNEWMFPNEEELSPSTPRDADKIRQSCDAGAVEASSFDERRGNIKSTVNEKSREVGETILILCLRCLDRSSLQQEFKDYRSNVKSDVMETPSFLRVIEVFTDMFVNLCCWTHLDPGRTKRMFSEWNGSVL